MAKNDEGEFELILGNRQLISVFLIVVILLGVFFSMGYIVGRNSATAALPVETAHSGSPDAPAPAASTPAPAPTATEPAPAAPEPAPESTHPAQTASEQPVEPPAPAPAPPAPKPAAKAVAKAAKPSPAPPAPVMSGSGGEPGPGQYWQVVATSRPDAEIITEALVKKGFHAVLAPAPKEGVFRVLVGPLKDAATQSQTRTQLEAAGFKNPMARKY